MKLILSELILLQLVASTAGSSGSSDLEVSIKCVAVVFLLVADVVDSWKLTHSQLCLGILTGYSRVIAIGMQLTN